MATVSTGCCSTFVEAQTATVIPANEAAAHIGEYATVEGVVAKVFTSKTGNTFLNIGATYPNQTFTGWIPPASPVSKSPLLTGIEGKRVKITGRIETPQTGGPRLPIGANSISSACERFFRSRTNLYLNPKRST
jgi:hypothetical protein